MHSKKIIGAIAFSAITAAALTACGGGGGSAGDTQERYTLDMQVLPSSVLFTYPDTGYARRTDTYNAVFESEIILHVRHGDDDLAPDGVGVSCHVDGVGVGGFVAASGTNSNSGSSTTKPSCEAATTVPAMTYTTTGTTTAGVYRLHFHAGNTPTEANNEARIVCRVIDPRDSRSYEAEQRLRIVPAPAYSAAGGGDAADFCAYSGTPQEFCAQTEDGGAPRVMTYAEAVGCETPAPTTPTTPGGVSPD